MATTPIRLKTPHETFELKDTLRLQLIDVRTSDEFTGDLGHIEGASLLTLLPGEEDNFIEGLKKFAPEKPTIFICRSGNRSAKATALAQALPTPHTFTDAYNMAGGMLAWNDESLPLGH